MTLEPDLHQLAQACRRLEPQALRLLATFPPDHPVARDLHNASLDGDKESILVFRALPIACPVRQAWHLARRQSLDEWYRHYRGAAEGAIRYQMRLVPDRENYVAQFWQDFCERGEELTYKRDEADRKATFIAMRARYWSLTKLARLIQERRDAERFAKSQPDSEPPVAPKPDRRWTWMRLERLVLCGRLAARDILAFLLADIVGPAKLASGYLDHTLGQLIDLLTEVPASMTDLLRGELGDATLGSLTAPTGRPAADAIADWVENAHRILHQGVPPGDWPAVESLAEKVERKTREDLSLEVEFLRHSLSSTEGPRLLVWACRRMFRLPLQRFRELTAREAAQDLRRRVNLVLPGAPLSPQDADRLMGREPDRRMEEIIAALPDRTARTTHEDYEEYADRQRRLQK